MMSSVSLAVDIFQETYLYFWTGTIAVCCVFFLFIHKNNVRFDRTHSSLAEGFTENYGF